MVKVTYYSAKGSRELKVYSHGQRFRFISSIEWFSEDRSQSFRVTGQFNQTNQQDFKLIVIYVIVFDDVSFHLAKIAELLHRKNNSKSRMS